MKIQGPEARMTDNLVALQESLQDVFVELDTVCKRLHSLNGHGDPIRQRLKKVLSRLLERSYGN